METPTTDISCILEDLDQWADYYLKKQQKYSKRKTSTAYKTAKYQYQEIKTAINLINNARMCLPDDFRGAPPVGIEQGRIEKMQEVIRLQGKILNSIKIHCG